jgi:hypothetical protein
MQKSDHWHRGLLRACGERPEGRRSRRATDKGDELATFHHEEIPARPLGEYLARWDRKVAYSPEAAWA